MADTVEIRGADSLIAGLERIIQETPQAVAAALFQEAERVMADAKENYVPVDTGILRDSGMVSEPEIGDGEISVSMGFGGAAEAYAVVQHERMDFHHTVGGPKYLERPFLDAANGLEERLALALEPLING